MVSSVGNLIIVPLDKNYLKFALLVKTSFILVFDFFDSVLNMISAVGKSWTI